MEFLWGRPGKAESFFWENSEEHDSKSAPERRA